MSKDIKATEEIVGDVIKAKIKSYQKQALEEIEKEIEALDLKIKITKEMVNVVEKQVIISEANKRLIRKYNWGVNITDD